MGRRGDARGVRHWKRGTDPRQVTDRECRRRCVLLQAQMRPNQDVAEIQGSPTCRTAVEESCKWNLQACTRRWAGTVGMHLPEFTAVGMLGFAMRSGVTRTTPKDAEHRQVRSRSLEGASTRSAQRDRLGASTRVQSPGYTASQNPSREACQQQQRTQQQRLGTQQQQATGQRA